MPSGVVSSPVGPCGGRRQEVQGNSAFRVPRSEFHPDSPFRGSSLPGLAEALRTRGFVVHEHPQSINAQLPGSRLRLRITLNSRYAHFPNRAVTGKLFGIELPVACLEDLVQGKLWAATDPQRRASKRVKDRADLIRLCESLPRVIGLIPSGVVPEVDEMRGG